jgi:REP element-mobilizing transposase RayT
MPKVLVRSQSSGGFHFITFSCYHREPYLGSPSSRNLFERSLGAKRIRYEFFIAGYVVMPEHVHLLLSEPRRVLLAKALQALKLSVAVQSASGTCGSAATTTKAFWGEVAAYFFVGVCFIAFFLYIGA